MKLRGLHNVENVLAALAAGLACGAAPDSMRQTIKEFCAGRAPAGVCFRNRGRKVLQRLKSDERGRNRQSARSICRTTGRGKIVLILGGRGKKAPYAPLASLVSKKVRNLILIGEDAETIANELGDFAPE